MSIIRKIIFLAIILSGCQEDKSDSFLNGIWSNDAISSSMSMKLELHQDYRFSIYNFPSKLICGSDAEIKINGAGVWEYDRPAHRLILIFENISNNACPSPYMSNAFVESDLFDAVIVFYPDGPDNKASSVSLKKIKT